MVYRATSCGRRENVRPEALLSQSKGLSKSPPRTRYGDSAPHINWPWVSRQLMVGKLSDLAVPARRQPIKPPDGHSHHEPPEVCEVGYASGVRDLRPQRTQPVKQLQE